MQNSSFVNIELDVQIRKIQNIKQSYYGMGVLLLFPICRHNVFFSLRLKGCRGHDCMIVRFTTTCAINAHHH
jgi:hypothetical protein